MKVPREYLVDSSSASNGSSVYARLNAHIDAYYPGLFAVVRIGDGDWPRFTEKLHILPGESVNRDPWYTPSAIAMDLPEKLRLFARAQSVSLARRATAPPRRSERKNSPTRLLATVGKIFKLTTKFSTDTGRVRARTRRY